MPLYITNDETSSPETIWREYRSRISDENVIKDLKEGYGFASFNKNNFRSAEAVMLFNALIFHNIIHYLNRKALNVNKAKEHIKTIRLKYLVIPARSGSDGGYSVLGLAVRNRKLRAKLNYTIERIALLPLRLKCNAVDAS